MSNDTTPQDDLPTNNDNSLQPTGGIPYTTVFIFYLVLVGIAVSVGSIWGVDPISPYFDSSIPGWGAVLIGAILGLLVVGVSRLLEFFFESFRRLGNIFAKILGPLGISGALFLAIASSVGEEIFFRGFLQQLLDTVTFAGVVDGDWYAVIITSLIFGIVHTGPNPRVFLPWTLFALVVGFLLGILYVITGNLLGPIVMHFTINFLNLSALSKRAYGTKND